MAEEKHFITSDDVEARKGVKVVEICFEQKLVEVLDEIRKELKLIRTNGVIVKK